MRLSILFIIPPRDTLKVHGRNGFPEIHSQITNSCMTYFSYETFAEDLYKHDPGAMEGEYPFFM